MADGSAGDRGGLQSCRFGLPEFPSYTLLPIKEGTNWTLTGCFPRSDV